MKGDSIIVIVTSFDPLIKSLLIEEAVILNEFIESIGRVKAGIENVVDI